MAANINLKLSLRDSDTSTLSRDLQPEDNKMRYSVVQRLQMIVGRMATGNNPGSVEVSVSASSNQASGTVTAATVQAADTITINGVVLTAVASSPAANQFIATADNTETAVNIAAAINSSASALLSQQVSASSAGAVVTIRSLFDGAAGNQATLASSNNTRLAVSGARLSGGVADASAITYSF